MFALGFVHALGPDHLAAITALAGTQATRRAVLVTSLRFALAHTGVLFAATCAAFLLGFVPSRGTMQVAEILGGLTLVAVGALTVHAALIHKTVSRHVHRPGWVGSLLAAGGTRSLVLAVPAGATGHVGTSLVVTLAFGLGVVAAMAAFGLLLGAGRERAAASPRLQWSAAVFSGALAVCVGVYWTFASII